MFNVPPSSSPPTTPNWRQRKPVSQFFSASNPSTTPAGPPPSSYSAASTTPAGPPPSSTFGSSRLNQPDFSTSGIFARNDIPSSPLRGGGRFASLPVDEDAMDEDVERAGNMNNWPASTNNDDEDQDENLLGDGLNIQAVAKTLSAPISTLFETNHVVLETEDIVEKVQSIIDSGDAADEIGREALLGQAVDSMLHTWQTSRDPSWQQEGGIGPHDSASPFTKAFFVSTLAFAVNCPSKSDPSSQLATKPLPEALIAWLKEYHSPFPDDFREVLQFRPNSTAHERFWDVLLSLTLRGDLAEVARLLKDADFREALTALGDGADEPGYHGKQLTIVQKVVNRAISVVEACPALHSNDWNTSNADWAVFRKRVHQALNDLDALVKGSNQSLGSSERHELEASHFGLSSVASSRQSMSQRLQKAESKVPWTIYTNLKYLYDQLLGKSEELMAAAADWVEAAIGLTVWWDGESDITGRENLRASRLSASKSQITRAIDLYPRKAYQDRLRLSLNYVLAQNQDAELQVNTMNPVQVGIAAIFEQDLFGLVTILRGWSTVVATTVAEIASYGGWRGTADSSSKKLLNKFNQSDLMVLSFGKQPDATVDVDQVRIAYADILAQKGSIGSFEGWQLAIGVLGRLENAGAAKSRINSLLNSLDLTTVARVENVLTVCVRLGLGEQARQVAESFGDYLTSSTDDYGDALYYYARARQPSKLTQIIDVLISTSLIQSTLYPAQNKLDRTLHSMVSSPQETLARLRALDTEAAALLSSQLSGYATLRKFYELRDHPSSLYKRDAATALTSVIMSSADSIHGGLFDESVSSAVAVENLLLLLGETLPFLSPQPEDGRHRNQGASPALLSPQIFAIMKALEDLCSLPDYETTPIFTKCEERMRVAIANAHGSELPSKPRAILKKSISSLTNASSQFSLLGGESSSSQELTAMDTDGMESGVLISKKPAREEEEDEEDDDDNQDEDEMQQSVNVKRAWDWRVGLPLNASGSDLIKILRLGLARQVARAWTQK